MHNIPVSHFYHRIFATDYKTTLNIKSMTNKFYNKRKLPPKLSFLFLMIFVQIFASNSWAQNLQNVKAKIVDESNEPMIGVSIVVKGANTGTITDHNGEFTIKVAAGKILVLSYIGYKDLELSLSAVNGKVIKMTENSKLMDEVVVVGYGTQRKIDVSGAVSSVNADVTKDRVIQNIGDALKGQVSGVVVTSLNGAPGSVSSISIRGNTSLSSDSEPLYVIDGVISEATDVVPSQIATIDILKDASSTAIYGSRGANGVILITTNQGKKNSKAKVDLYALYGAQKLTKFIPMMNAEQFADFKYLSYINTAGNKYDPALDGKPWSDISTGAMTLVDNEGHLWTQARNTFYADYFNHLKTVPSNTDWQKEIYRIAPTQDYRLIISGGADKSTYSVMLGYNKQEGIKIASGSEVYNFRFNLRQAISDKMNVRFTSSLEKKLLDNAKAEGILNISPFLNKDSANVQLPSDQEPSSLIQNPLLYSKIITNNYTDLVYSNTGNFDWLIIKGLTLYLSGTYATRQFVSETFYPSNSHWSGKANNGLATLTQRRQEELRSENTLQYDTKIQRHNIGFMLGNSISTVVVKRSTAQNSNFNLQDLGVWGMLEGLSPATPTYGYVGYNNLSWFGRANYTYANKYILKASMRADGASVFAKNYKWGYFPSVGAAWRVNEEKFLKSVQEITNFKLRASYGVSGKQAISPYQSLATASISKITTDGISNSGSLLFNRLGNDNLKWETTREIDLGFDLGLLKNRLNIVFDVYDKRTSDLLYLDPLPLYSGFSSVISNIGEVQNRGIEFSIASSPFKNKNGFNWDVNFNISKNVSEILSLGQQSYKMIGTGWSGSNAVQGILKVGEPLGNWYGYKTDGLWQSFAEIDAARANGTLASGIPCYPGYIKYQDISGPNGVPDGKITSDDRQILGNAFPAFTGGLTNSFNYKGIGLNITLQYSIGQKVFNATQWGADAVSASYSGWSYGSDILQSFRPTLYQYDAVTGQKGELFIEGIASNRYPTFLAQRVNNTEEIPLDWYIQDASFLRVADVTFSYSLNKKVLSKLNISNVKVFLTGSNLFVFTNYKGYDPEVNGSQGQASYLMPGLDNQTYPKARIISVGMNATF